MMTIEQKAKAYDKAINRCREFYETLGNPKLKEEVEEIFPELKESENIRIIKAIKYGLDHVFTNNTTVFEVTKEQCLAWLEKQGEQKTTDEIGNYDHGKVLETLMSVEMKTPEESLDISSKEYNITGIGSKNAQGKLGEMIKNLKPVNEVLEQKPAWGEEDIELLDNTIKFIEDSVAATSPSLRTYSPTLTGKEIPFLKSIKERVQPKQEWSEEDKNMLQSILDEYKSMPIEKRNWLKSLKERVLPQPKWKPSDEQMKVLTAISSKEILSEYERGMLVGLYTELQKLKEK